MLPGMCLILFVYIDHCLSSTLPKLETYLHMSWCLFWGSVLCKLIFARLQPCQTCFDNFAEINWKMFVFFKEKELTALLRQSAAKLMNLVFSWMLGHLACTHSKQQCTKFINSCLPASAMQPWHVCIFYCIPFYPGIGTVLLFYWAMYIISRRHIVIYNISAIYCISAISVSHVSQTIVTTIYLSQLPLPHP